LRTTTQRVNLFEKKLIPELRENIRRIKIFLGDDETAAVGRAKLAKGKLVQKEVTGK
jgi:V/A-type H+-transporting ATPase subunit D